MFIVLKVFRGFVVGLSVLPHSVASLDSAVPSLVKVVPADFDHRGVVYESVESVQAEAI